MDRDSDVGAKDFAFGATGLAICALVAIVLAIVG
jgi:hypothetical protein